MREGASKAPADASTSGGSCSSRAADGDAEQVLAVLCHGRRFEHCSPDLSGFQRRAAGSFFQPLLEPEVKQLKDPSGALVVSNIQVEMFENIWAYLTHGHQPPILSLTELCEWQRLCDFFALRVPDPLDDVRKGTAATAYATQRYLLVRPVSSFDLSPMSYQLRCAEACRLQPAPLGFDDVDVGGSLRLKASSEPHPLEVKLDPDSGTLGIRFLDQALWHHIGGHMCLKGKRMVALKVSVVQLPSADGGAEEPKEVLELYLHMRSRRHRQWMMSQMMSPSWAQDQDSPSVSEAPWPSFWCVVRLVRWREEGSARWASWNSSFEICPGALYIMDGDLIVQVVSQPRSLQTCFMRFCGGGLPGKVRMRLYAPKPFMLWHGTYSKGGKGSTYSKGGKGGKGGPASPGLVAGRKYYHNSVPAYDTPQVQEVESHPEGRSMQQVWVVRRRAGAGATPHLVVLQHAMDGRVAVAQLSGERGDIPQAWYVGFGDEPQGRFACEIWGERGRNRSNPWRSIGGVGAYRRAYDVPKCHEVLGVALDEAERVTILHRPRARSSPQLWVISPPKASAEVTRRTAACFRTFFRTSVKGKGKGMKGAPWSWMVEELGGSWVDDRWGTAGVREVILPRDIVEAAQSGPAQASADDRGDPGFPMFVALGARGDADVETLLLSGRINYSGGYRRSRHSDGYGYRETEDPWNLDSWWARPPQPPRPARMPWEAMPAPPSAAAAAAAASWSRENWSGWADRDARASRGPGWSGPASASKTSTYTSATGAYAPTEEATWYVGRSSHFHCLAPRVDPSEV